MGSTTTCTLCYFPCYTVEERERERKNKNKTFMVLCNSKYMYIVIVKYSKMNTFYSKRLDMTFFFTVAEKKVLKNQLSVNMYIF